ncbi:MAG: EAL domain-containing response regulator [Gammaproteobacteria bacterium]
MNALETLSMAANNKTISILLIDDEPFVLDLAQTMLENLGYKNVDTASNGNVALGKLITSEQPYELIICDLNMPEMDGVEFMRHACNSEYKGGIIILSGEDTRMLETALGLGRAHKLDVLGALPKPLISKDLEALLANFEPKSDELKITAPVRSISAEDLAEGIRGSANNQLHLVYQPKIDVKSGAIVGVEALARWWNQERGVLGPAAFIPLAETSGQIDNLTHKIYSTALTQASEWAREGKALRTAINFSVNSFTDPVFCEFVLTTQTNSGLGSESLLLEITETQAMNIPASCLEALMSLRLKRFGLSIDDFGTGNSSMAQLKNIPFSEMKIDRAFVNGAANDSSSQAILEASIGIARKLNMDIVAEGVETREDWDIAEQLGCDYVQGFYCARPMRSEDLATFMSDWSGPH